MSAKVIALPIERRVQRLTAGVRITRENADRLARESLERFSARFVVQPREPSADAEIQADRIAVHVPFASALIDAEQARELACKLLLLAVRLDERKADK